MRRAGSCHRRRTAHARRRRRSTAECRRAGTRSCRRIDHPPELAMLELLSARDLRGIARVARAFASIAPRAVDQDTRASRRRPDPTAALRSPPARRGRRVRSPGSTPRAIRGSRSERPRPRPADRSPSRKRWSRKRQAARRGRTRPARASALPPSGRRDTPTPSHRRRAERSRLPRCSCASPRRQARGARAPEAAAARPSPLRPRPVRLEGRCWADRIRRRAPAAARGRAAR